MRQSDGRVFPTGLNCPGCRLKGDQSLRRKNSISPVSKPCELYCAIFRNVAA